MSFQFGQIPSLLAEQPISVLNRQYEEVAEFLHRISGIHASLEELSISDELVDWLKEAMKGISVCPCSVVSATYVILYACCDKHGRLLSMLIDSLSVPFT